MAVKVTGERCVVAKHIAELIAELILLRAHGLLKKEAELLQVLNPHTHTHIQSAKRPIKIPCAHAFSVIRGLC